MKGWLIIFTLLSAIIFIMNANNAIIRNTVDNGICLIILTFSATLKMDRKSKAKITSNIRQFANLIFFDVCINTHIPSKIEKNKICRISVILYENGNITKINSKAISDILTWICRKILIVLYFMVCFVCWQ
jgi:predicted HAD superfamily hydrolase